MNFGILALKAEKLSDLIRRGSELFLSIMVNRKHVFERKVVFCV